MPRTESCVGLSWQDPARWKRRVFRRNLSDVESICPSCWLIFSDHLFVSYHYTNEMFQCWMLVLLADLACRLILLCQNLEEFFLWQCLAGRVPLHRSISDSLLGVSKWKSNSKAPSQVVVACSLFGLYNAQISILRIHYRTNIYIFLNHTILQTNTFIHIFFKNCKYLTKPNSPFNMLWNSRINPRSLEPTRHNMSYMCDAAASDISRIFYVFTIWTQI